MKICFVINRLLAGGAQNTLKSVADGIGDQNYKLKILAFEKKRKKDVKFKKNINVSYLNKKNINNNILNFFLFFYFILKNRNNLDYLISTGDAQTIIICRIVCFLFKIKHIPWIQFHYKTPNLISLIRQRDQNTRSRKHVVTPYNYYENRLFYKTASSFCLSSSKLGTAV